MTYSSSFPGASWLNAPKKANGLLGLLGVSSNPFTDFLGNNSNTLIGLGAGIAGGGPDLGQAVGQGLTLAGQGKTADFNRSEKAKADATLAANENQTKVWLAKNRPHLANLPIGEAWDLAMKSPVSVGKGDTLVDPMTHQPLYTNGGGDTAGGPYEGTGMDAQNWNILLTGDPSTPEYAAAWSQINQPKITYTQGPEGLLPVIQNPNVPSSIRPPTGVSPSVAQGSPGDGGAAGPGGITAGTPVPGTIPKLTEQQIRAQMMAKVIAPEVQTLLGDGTANNPGAFDTLANGFDQAKDVTGNAGRILPFGLGTPSADFLKAKGSIRTLVASYLYVASGATANPGEVDNQTAILTPQLNDPPEVIAQKRARLLTMAQAVQQSASGRPVDLNAILSGASAGDASQNGGTTSSGVQWSVSP